MKRRVSYNLVICLSLVLVSLSATPLMAQSGRDFERASQLMQAGSYEQAYSILQKLLKQNPDSYPVYDYTVTCLIQLKNYDEAIKLTRDQLGSGYKNLILAARLGELYHMKGDTTTAYEIWNRSLEANKKQMSAYRYIAQTMNKNQEFNRATQVFKKGQQYFHNDKLFLFEMATNYLEAGQYEQSVREYLKVIKANKNQLPIVESFFQRYNDNGLYDAAIAVTQNTDTKKEGNTDFHQSLKQFLLWLYMERSHYNKALDTARELEKNYGDKSHPVFQTGLKLLSENKFRLAEEAFDFYISQKNHPLAANSLEEKARLDIKWADYYDEYHLNFDEKTDSLYHSAYQTINTLLKKYPDYNRLNSVLTLQAELALNHVKDAKAAQKYVDDLRKLPANKETSAMIDYLMGRIALFNGNFEMARVYFTRSNKKSQAGLMADRTRYFLSLTDFFARDYHYAVLQIKELERNSTSFYANNALQLRVWIQNGMDRDSVTSELNSFSKAQYLYSTGKANTAVDSLLPYVTSPYYRPMKDDMMLFILKIMKRQNPALAFALSDQYLASGFGSLGERIMWEHAQLAQQIHENSKLQKNLKDLKYHFPLPEYLQKHQPDILSEKTRKKIIHLTANPRELVKLYESILMRYPQGFYAAYARNQIRKLQQESPL